MADEEKNEDKIFNYVNQLFSKIRHLKSSNSKLPMSSPYGTAKCIKEGDVVGIALDLTNDSSKIEYYLNGVSQGIAFEAIDYEKSLFPVVGLKKDQSTTLVFELDKLKFKSKIPSEYVCLNVPIDKKGNKVLWTLKNSVSIEGKKDGINVVGNSKFGFRSTAILKSEKLQSGNKYYFEWALEADQGRSVFFGFVDAAFKFEKSIGKDDHSWVITSKMQKLGIIAKTEYSKAKTSELENSFDKIERGIVINHLQKAGFEECSFGFELNNYEKLEKYHDEMQRKRVDEFVQVKKSISQKVGYPILSKRLEATARVLLCGVYDDNHSLSMFGGMRYIIKAIWEFANDFNVHIWSKHIKFKEEEDFWSKHKDSKIYCVSMGHYSFPKPSGININMMPFVMSYDFSRCKLPFYLQSYHSKLITKCLEKNSSLRDTICFLTINESFVKKGHTQRRPGLHVENPGKDPFVGGGKVKLKFEYDHQHIGHGGGSYVKHPVDGIFMASNVNDSCKIYECSVDKVNEKEIIGKLGDIEHLKGFIESRIERMTMKANELVWITDRTPHGSLPMKQSGDRQFFRVISSKLSTWYKKHNTANIYGLLPDSKETQIVDINKFE